MIESDWESFITCAQCGAEDQETCEYPENLRHDGDEAKWECTECGAEGTVRICVEYSYQTRMPEKPGTPCPLNADGKHKDQNGMFMATCACGWSAEP